MFNKDLIIHLTFISSTYVMRLKLPTQLDKNGTMLLCMKILHCCVLPLFEILMICCFVCLLLFVYLHLFYTRYTLFVQWWHGVMMMTIRVYKKINYYWMLATFIFHLKMYYFILIMFIIIYLGYTDEFILINYFRDIIIQSRANRYQRATILDTISNTFVFFMRILDRGNKSLGGMHTPFFRFRNSLNCGIRHAW